MDAGQDFPARLTAWVRGRVQGVGFRWWVRARALELGLTGAATNLGDGRVEVVAEGPRKRCEELLALLRGGDTPGKVAGVVDRWENPRGTFSGFIER
ncbi:acylphosphatase [Streptomonospora wellingtoniae]|uniref:acylphosphatase n=1 Tax=Streptomonospora wellingtoniae TaxID=3075544 RepID=A0ABU2KZE6_9ACTN|nr:acylphosphatase [Streptomonospora sp. DSM 45055]MDT0304679.1 acylphosphatase [Streptomonospora sp. DSM 45055]